MVTDKNQFYSNWIIYMDRSDEGLMFETSALESLPTRWPIYLQLSTLMINQTFVSYGLVWQELKLSYFDKAADRSAVERTAYTYPN